MYLYNYNYIVVAVRNIILLKIQIRPNLGIFKMQQISFHFLQNKKCLQMLPETIQ